MGHVPSQLVPLHLDSDCIYDVGAKNRTGRTRVQQNMFQMKLSTTIIQLLLTLM